VLLTVKTFEFLCGYTVSINWLRQVSKAPYSNFTFSLLAIFVQLRWYINIHKSLSLSLLSILHYMFRPNWPLWGVYCVRCWINGTCCSAITRFCFSFWYKMLLKFFILRYFRLSCRCYAHIWCIFCWRVGLFFCAVCRCSHFTSKAEQRDDRVAGSFNPTSYTPDDGQLGRNM
jgi:hypothetical protein